MKYRARQPILRDVVPGRTRLPLPYLILLLLIAVLAAPAQAATPLEQAREEQGDPPPTPDAFDLPSAAELTVTPSEFLSTEIGREITFTVRLDRPAPGAELELLLPGAFTDVPDSGIRPVGPPRAGPDDELERAGDRVRLQLRDGETESSVSLRHLALDVGRHTVELRWRAPGGELRPAGRAYVRVFAPAREPVEKRSWEQFPARTAFNVSADNADQSEAFAAVVPALGGRTVLGVNHSRGSGGATVGAWESRNGGADYPVFPYLLPDEIDVQGGPGTTNIPICCDPMMAADARGHVWVGGITDTEPSVSRTVVGRLGPDRDGFGPFAVGLPRAPGTGQDKPLMTIDDSPTSPTRGRLWVVWGEGGAATTRLVAAYCDSRPLVATCDNADNWQGPFGIRGAVGSVIYAEPAVGPDGKLYVTWWDFGADNDIRGLECPAPCSGSQLAGTDARTIAQLDVDDATNEPVPFSCPIPVAPGGRVAPQPTIEVDTSQGPNRGRVYVAWSDLRDGSGTTRCGTDETNPYGTPPLVTHDSWDVFLASAQGTLPGGEMPSAQAGTRIVTDAPGTSSDEFFPALGVDPVTGDVWTGFYSSAPDPERDAVRWWVRPQGGDPRVLSENFSSFSDMACCDFGNDFGDYEGLAAAACQVVPAWTERQIGSDPELATDKGVRLPQCYVPGPARLTEGPGADGDGRTEPGEIGLITLPITNAGTAAQSGNLNLTFRPQSNTLAVRANGTQSVPGPNSGETVEARAVEVVLNRELTCDVPVRATMDLSAAGRTQPLPLDITPTCDPRPEPTPTITPTPPPPTVKPGLLDLSVPEEQRRSTVLSRGLLVELFCAPRCQVVLTADLDARSAKRLKLKSRRLGRLVVLAARGRPQPVRVKFSAAARRALRKAGRTKLTISVRGTVADVSPGETATLTGRSTLAR